MKKLYVQHIIDYVEKNIEHEICIDDVAEYIGYSKFYLQRIFYIYIGVSIMQYVKNRKLEYSLIDLKTDVPIVEIALKYGFQSRRVYSRLFKNHFGVSPTNYRHNMEKLSPKIELNEIGGIKMLTYLSEPKVVKIDDLYGLARSVISKNPEEEVINLQVEYKIENKLHVFHEIGFDVPVSHEEQQQGIRGYEYWLCVGKDEFDQHVEKEVEKVHIPPSKYLTLAIDDPFSNPFDRILNGWKKLSAAVHEKYEFNDTLPFCGFEETIMAFSGTTMNIYLPIK